MKRLAIFLLPCILAACSNEDSPPPAAPEKPYQPWKAQTDALDKAKALEGQIQQDFEQRDQQMREQGG